MEGWKTVADKIGVSVYCLAYNHEKYIRKTLEGFVNQKTSFKYEVYVHDDASTDGTAAIIREYEQQYPDIIHGIYQTENQYSKGVDIVADILLPKLTGEYIACCEGDDYWSNSNKLQMQYQVMCKQRNIGLCIGKVRVINEDGTSANDSYPSAAIPTGLIDNKKFIDLVCNDFFQISGCFFRADALIEASQNKPQYWKYADVGDIPLYLYFGSEFDGVYYIDEMVSCYRLNSIHSWNNWVKKNQERLIEHRNSMIYMIEEFDQYTDNRFHSSCMDFKEKEEFIYNLRCYNLGSIFGNKHHLRRFLQYPFRTKLSIIWKALFKNSELCKQ